MVLFLHIFFILWIGSHAFALYAVFFRNLGEWAFRQSRGNWLYSLAPDNKDKFIIFYKCLIAVNLSLGIAFYVLVIINS